MPVRAGGREVGAAAAAAADANPGSQVPSQSFTGCPILIQTLTPTTALTSLETRVKESRLHEDSTILAVKSQTKGSCVLLFVLFFFYV